MKRPYISVVIPAYNAALYLEECLDSLLSQDYQELEIICVNDGSTDNSLDILVAYAEKDTRIRIIDVPNGGYGKAMNLGLNVASGKYFAILEPDDYLPLSAYSLLVEIAETYNLQIAKGNTIRFSTDALGERKCNDIVPYPVTNQVIQPRNYPNLFTIAPSTWSAIYRLDFLRKNDICYNESPGASYQDTGFFMQTMCFAERVMFVDTPSYMYRTSNAASSTNTRSSKVHVLTDEFTFIRKRLEARSKTWGVTQGVFLVRRFVSHRWIYESVPASMKLEYLNRFREELLNYERLDCSKLSYSDRLQMNDLLVSSDYFMSMKSLREINEREKKTAALMRYYSRLLRNYRLTQFKCFLALGKRREKYMVKINKLRTLIREARAARNNEWNRLFK